MNTEIFEKLDRDFFEKIENTDIENKHRIMILFSGVPECGKEELAISIRDKFKGILVTKDKARNLIYKDREGIGIEEVEETLDEYMETVVERLTKSKNGLVIHDASIDRKYEKYKGWAEKYGYDIFVVRMDTSRDIVKQNIETKFKDDEGTKKWFLEQLDRWYNDFEKYKGKVDFVVKDIKAEQMQELFNILDKKLG